MSQEIWNFLIESADISESSNFNTLISQFEDGAEQRRRKTITGNRGFELQYGIVTATQAKEMQEFFLDRYGSFDNFWFMNPKDNPVTGDLVAIGNQQTIGALGFAAVSGLAYDPVNDILYGADDATNVLITINKSTGAGSSVGALGFSNVVALAYDPNNGILYGSHSSGTEIITINVSTGAGTGLGSHGIAGIIGLAFDANTNILYAVSNSTDSLYTVNVTTGALTLVGTLVNSSSPSDITFDANNNIMYLVDEVLDEIFTVNTATGVATSIRTISFGNVQGLAFNPNNGALYATDITTDNLVQIGNPFIRMPNFPVVPGSETLYLNGTPMTDGVDYTLDDANGLITLANGLMVGSTVTADFSFYWVVRFANDAFGIRSLYRDDAFEVNVPLVLDVGEYTSRQLPI